MFGSFSFSFDVVTDNFYIDNGLPIWSEMDNCMSKHNGIIYGPPLDICTE